MARSSGSVSARQADHAPRRRVAASAGRPAAMASAPSTLSRWAPGAKSAISPRCAAALAASPFWSIQVTASSTRRCRSAACGLCRAASTRLAVAAGHAWRSASRRANASRSAASAASGTVAAATRCRSTAAGSATNAAAAVCSALRRATPSESCTADRTSGCGKATVTGVPGPGSAMRPAAVVSSNGASGSSSPANDATCGSGLCMPSTAAASTRSRAAAEQPDQRSLTTRRNERGEGSGHSPVPHDCAGNSASSALACSGLPRVPSRRRRAATGDNGDPSWAARSRSSGSARPGSAMAAPACPSTTRRRPSGSPVTASRTPIRTSTWSATSRRSANSSAERDGRSAQCASSTTTTTTASSPASSSRSSSRSNRVPTVTGLSSGRAGPVTAAGSSPPARASCSTTP